MSLWNTFGVEIFVVPCHLGIPTGLISAILGLGVIFSVVFGNRFLKLLLMRVTGIVPTAIIP